MLVTLFSVLIVYMFATKDSPYVPINERPIPDEPKRKSINKYAWRGPMFVEEFGTFSGVNNPKEEVVPTPSKCEIPKYNASVPGVRGCHEEALGHCMIGPMTAEGSWRHEYHNAPYKLGQCNAFDQVTNNNLSAPNNLKSAQLKGVMGDWFGCDKVSPWCYATHMNKCAKFNTCNPETEKKKCPTFCSHQ